MYYQLLTEGLFCAGLFAGLSVGLLTLIAAKV